MKTFNQYTEAKNSIKVGDLYKQDNGAGRAKVIYKVDSIPSGPRFGAVKYMKSRQAFSKSIHSLSVSDVGKSLIKIKTVND